MRHFQHEDTKVTKGDAVLPMIFRHKAWFEMKRFNSFGFSSSLRVFVLALVLPVSAMSQTASGGLDTPFALGGSARVLGMGNTGLALTGSGDGFFLNPATLATLRDHQILTFHAPLLQDTNYDSIGYVHPVASHSSFGLALARLGTDNILQTQNNIQAVSTFSAEEFQGLLGYGFQVVEDLDFGATVKYLRQQIGTYQASGMGVDLGLLYHLGKTRQDFAHFGYKNLTVGLAVSNALQPQTRLFQDVDQPVRVYRPGLSYLFQPSDANVFWLTAEGVIPESGVTMVKAGLEYGWNDTVFARAGYDGFSPTAGGGLKFSGFEFDYAFNQGDMGAFHRFSLSYSFDTYRDPLQAQKIDLLKWVARSYAKNNDYDPAIHSWKNVLNEFPDDREASQAIKDLERKRSAAVQDQVGAAKAAVARGDFDKALPLVAKVLALDPGNPDAKDLLKRIDKKLLVSTNYLRGVEAYTKEDYASAVQYLQSVYELDPHYRDVNFLYHDAQSHYLPLESMSKETTDLYAKGVNYYMNGEYPKAIEVWEKVLEKNPKNFLVQRNLEEARSRLKDKALPGSAIPSPKAAP